jgi:hypothetical protein
MGIGRGEWRDDATIAQSGRVGNMNSHQGSNEHLLHFMEMEKLVECVLQVLKESIPNEQRGRRSRVRGEVNLLPRQYQRLLMNLMLSRVRVTSNYSP